MARNIDIRDFARFVGLTMKSSGYSISPLKLQKILYYEQAWHMAILGRDETLFRNIPQAWVNGPVYPEIYHEYRGRVLGMCDLLSYKDFNSTEEEAPEEIRRLLESFQFTERERDLCYSVINLYGSKTQNQLIFATHSEEPWIEARGGRLPFESSRAEISLDTMCRYYRARYDRNHKK